MSRKIVNSKKKSKENMTDVSAVRNQIINHEHFNGETFRKYYFNNQHYDLILKRLFPGKTLLTFRVFGLHHFI